MSATQTQVGGSHYNDMAIQPIEFTLKNGLGFCEGNVIKYVSRHKSKGGRKDLEKAIHYLQLLIEQEYPEHPKVQLTSPDCGDGYRLLVNGEPIIPGDEFWEASCNQWTPIMGFNGQIFDPHYYWPHRRKIEKGTK
jgi:hypothetical protein